MMFMLLQCVPTVIIVYIIIIPLNSYLNIHWILDFKYNITIIIMISDHITSPGMPASRVKFSKDT